MIFEGTKKSIFFGLGLTRAGNGFPEVSLLLPLCNELDITVNELLSGQRVSKEDYRKKAEENMVNMIREKEENKNKLTLTIIIGIISGITFITLLFVVCMYSDVMSLPAKIVLMVIGCSVYGIGLIVAMERITYKLRTKFPS